MRVQITLLLESFIYLYLTMSIMGFHKYLVFDSFQKIKNEPNCLKHTYISLPHVPK
jgi:hypothetical protein